MPLVSFNLLLHRYGLNSFQKLLLTLMQWVPPNLLTLIALSVPLAATLLFLPFDGSLSEVFPTYTYVFTAASIPIYNLFDAIDGK